MNASQSNLKELKVNGIWLTFYFNVFFLENEKLREAGLREMKGVNF